MDWRILGGSELFTVTQAGTESTRITVVIADDEPSVRLLVQATIAEDNFNVLEAEDGEEAWKLIQEARPKVVLLDVQMPGRTGLEVLRAIKTDPALADTRVILLTASASQSQISEGLAAGADAYLTKPFSPRDLLARLDEAIWL